MALIHSELYLAAASGRNVWSLWATRVTAILAVLLLIGCNENSEPSARGSSNKVRIGYIGLTCEAPIFMAVEKGFFKEEGLEASLVKCEWANYKDVLALGGFDVTHHSHHVFSQTGGAGIKCEVHGRNSSGLPSGAGGGERADSFRNRFEGQAHRRAGNGHAAVYFLPIVFSALKALIRRRTSVGSFSLPASSDWRSTREKWMRSLIRSRLAAS